MLEVEPEQGPAASDESLSTRNARLEDKVTQLTREKEELLRKVAHYEEYTKHLCSVLRKLKGSIDGLASQSTLISEALSYNCEAENGEQNDENIVPEQPQIQAKKKMQTASVLPMVRGFPIRRIIIPLQRLNINSHRHRPNRIHGHRREPWWRETEPEAPEPLQEVNPHRPGHGQRVPVRRLQRVERRPHRAVVRPRSRPGARRGQEAAVVERAGAQNRRGGSSHQMLQAVVLLQRLSLTQHQQQQQQRREQESQPLPTDGIRTPVVMLRDISTTVQTGETVLPKSEGPVAAASVEAEPAEGSSAGPSTQEEGDGMGRDIASAGPSGMATAVLSASPEVEMEASAATAKVSDDSQSTSTDVAVSDGVEAEVGACQELPPVLTPAEQGAFTVSEEEAGSERAAEPPPPPLSPFPLCGSVRAAEAADDKGTPPDGEAVPSETILPETEALEAKPSSATEAAADTSEPDGTSVAQSEPAHLCNGDTITSEHNEVSPPGSSGSSSPASADTHSSEGGVELPPRSPVPPNKEEPPDTASTPSSSRKRKASASVDSPDKSTGSPRSDVEREQSPENEQGSRPRRRCAIRTNYALFFAGWNAD